jgi:hypothetical protein
MSLEEYEAYIDTVCAELDRQHAEEMLQEQLEEQQQAELDAWLRECYAGRGLLIDKE